MFWESEYCKSTYLRGYISRISVNVLFRGYLFSRITNRWHIFLLKYTLELSIGDNLFSRIFRARKNKLVYSTAGVLQEAGTAHPSGAPQVFKGFVMFVSVCTF